MKLLANENIPLKTVKSLRKENLDIVSISEIKPGIYDKEEEKEEKGSNRCATH